MGHQDLKIGYSGGSGGFLLLHFLLLANQYHCEFDDDQSIEYIIDHQWLPKSMYDWKTTESFPNNYKTFKSTVSPKLYFFCNPFDHSFFNTWPFKELQQSTVTWSDIATDSIIIYTDIVSQLILAYNKKARWFLSPDKHRQLAWPSHYLNIKADSWPDCATWKDITQLPTYIQQELFDETNSYNTHSSIANDIMLEEESQSKATWPRPKVFNDILVDEDIYPYLEEAKYTIKLQDFVNSKGQLLAEQFNIAISNEQKQLFNNWISLHDAKILDQIGIHYCC